MEFDEKIHPGDGAQATEYIRNVLMKHKSVVSQSYSSCHRSTQIN